MQRMNKFNWELYETQIKQVLYLKAKNNPEAEAVFSVSEIVLNTRIESDDIARFERWMIDKGFVSLIRADGYNTFRCVVTDSLLDEQTNKLLFKK